MRRQGRAGEALGGGGVERADAHELALRVDERAAGVARVDGRVDLDEVAVDGVAARGLNQRCAGLQLAPGHRALDHLQTKQT